MQIETLHTTTLQVGGMSCRGCRDTVTRILIGVDGVHNVQVSLASGEAIVQYDELFTSPDKLILAVQQAGYSVEEESSL